MKKALILLSFLAICCFLCACGTSSTFDPAYKQMEDALSSTYNQVEDSFSTAYNQMQDAFEQVFDDGINNNELNDLKDDTTDIIPPTTKDNTLDQVTSTNDFEVSDDNNQDANSTENSFDEKTLLESYKGKPLPLFMEKISQSNYEVIYLADGVDFTDFIDLLKEDYITGDLTIDTENMTITVDLILASNIDYEKKEAALEEKLELHSSWSAAEKYGINKYGSNFELNYLLGKINESMDDENTWFLKAKCKLDGIEKTCEVKVTGTTDNPEIIFFDIY